MVRVITSPPLLPVFLRTLQKRAFAVSLLVVFFLTLFFGVQNLSKANTVFILDLPFVESTKLFLSTYFDLKNTFSLLVFALLIFISFVESLVLILFYEYMKLRHEALHAERASVLVSTLLTLFGTSCAACGGALLSVLSSFGLFGSSFFVHFFDSEILLGVVLVLLLVTLYRLLKKVANPLVC